MIDLDTRISNAIGRTWSSLLPRGAGLPWNRAVNAARVALDESNGIDQRHIRRGFRAESDITKTPHGTGLERCTIAFHNAATAKENNLWEGEHDVSWHELNGDERYNYTALFLSANFARNLDLLNSSFDFDLPKTDVIKEFPPNRCYCHGYFDRGEGCLEYYVRNGIEYAWRNRQVEINWDDALNWDQTTLVVLQAIYKNIKSLDQAEERESLTSICEEIHKDMIYYELWGNDTKQYSHHPYDPPGCLGPQKFFRDPVYRKNTDSNHRLNDVRQKENVVLLALAGLSAISDYKVMYTRGIFDKTEA